MARPPSPEGKMPAIHVSLQKRLWEEVDALRVCEELGSMSRTAAFLIRVGLGLYRRQGKLLFQLMNELEASESPPGASVVPSKGRTKAARHT